MFDLTWDSTYAIAVELKKQHPKQDLQEVSLHQIFLWTIELPGFIDDPSLSNEDILADIYQVWYEETLND
jgi:FeS assembly protein IscX